ncbi:MAG: hypothetical protein JST16_14125 [Bdellovibrionales bacterium]|nr:hypothetical protein [Bdellovibrionales bacterium]
MLRMKLALSGIFYGTLVSVSTLAHAVSKKNGIPVVPAAGKGYAKKVDFAKLEADYPLSPSTLAALKPADLASWDQESLDQLYARLNPGPIPDGVYEGTVILSDGGGLKSMTELATTLNIPMAYDEVKKFAETLWKGKHFYKSQGILRNMITNTKALEALVSPLQPVNWNAVPQAPLGGQNAREIFPAKLYCGQSLLDSRRESVIIDYAYTEELPGYQKGIDYLAGRASLAVRDEIRRVRPGLYLGRAYMGRAFVLNFTLYNAQAAAAGGGNEECWTGTQLRVSSN